MEYAQENHLGKVLGQGTIDVIIDHKYLIQAFGFLEEDTQFLFATSNYLIYSNKKLVGKNGCLHVNKNLL